MIEAVTHMQQLLYWADLLLYAAGAVVCLVLVRKWLRTRGDAPFVFLERPNRLDWPALMLTVAVFILSSWVGGALAGLLDLATLEKREVDDVRLTLINTGALLGGGIACAALGWTRFLDGWRGFGLSLWRIGRDLGASAVTLLAMLPLLMAALFLSERAVLTLFGADFITDHSAITMLENPAMPHWIRALIVATAVVVAPVAEELFFRGILQTRLGDVFPRRLGGVAVAAVCFGLVHSTQPAAVLPLTMMGFILGMVYERTGSLIAPILVHALFNAKSLLWHFGLNPS